VLPALWIDTGRRRLTTWCASSLKGRAILITRNGEPEGGKQ